MQIISDDTCDNYLELAVINAPICPEFAYDTTLDAGRYWIIGAAELFYRERHAAANINLH